MTRRFILCLILLTVSACLAGCADTTDPVLTFLAGESSKTGAMPTRYNWSGLQAKATVQETVVARTEDEWQALWNRVQQKAPAQLPDGKMAVAILLGERQTAGYGVEIVSVDRTQRLGQIDTLTVAYREFAPNVKDAAADTVTSPWAIQLTDTWPYDPVFQRQADAVPTGEMPKTSAP